MQASGWRRRRARAASGEIGGGGPVAPVVGQAPGLLEGPGAQGDVWRVRDCQARVPAPVLPSWGALASRPQGLVQPRRALGEVAPDVPEAGQGDGEAQGGWTVARGDQPAEGLAQVVVLSLQAFQALGAGRGARRAVAGLREAQVERGVALLHGLPFAAGGEAPPAVQAEGLQELVARRRVLLRSPGPAPPRPATWSTSRLSRGSISPGCASSPAPTAVAVVRLNVPGKAERQSKRRCSVALSRS